MITVIEQPREAGFFPLRMKQGYTPEWDVRLVRWLAGQTEGTMLEIGCNQGELTAELALEFPSRTVIGVDWLAPGAGTMCADQRHEMPNEVGRKAAYLSNVRLLNQNSRELDYTQLANLFGEIRCIFIDGDHSYDGVRADTNKALDYAAARKKEWMAAGETGRRMIIAWHDAYPEAPGWCGVWQFLQELSQFHDVKRFKDSWVCFAEV